MSQQGERPATEDEWWNRLYDESAPDIGPAAPTRDTLDDRFDSAADAVAAESTPEPAEPDDPRGPGDRGRWRPRAWWETRPTDAAAPAEPDIPHRPATPPRQRAAWERPTASDQPPTFRPASPPEPPRPDAASREAARLPRPDVAPRGEPEPPRPDAASRGEAPPPRPDVAPPREPARPQRPEVPRAQLPVPAENFDAAPAAPVAPGHPATRPDAVRDIPPVSGVEPSRREGPPGRATAPDEHFEDAPAPSAPHPPVPPRVSAEPPPPAPAARHAAPVPPQGLEAPSSTPVPPLVSAEPHLPAPPQTAAEPPLPPPDAGLVQPRPYVAYVGGGPPTYDAEPTALPAAQPHELDNLVADTVLDGAHYGTYTLRAASVRGDSARYRGEPRRDALLTARFGSGEAALVLVAVASGARAAEGAHLAAADACRWIGGAVGRSHARLAEDIRAGRRGDLKSGLHRLTDRSFGKLRARAAELGVEPEEYTANLRCLLLSADPECRTRVFFGVGGGGLFRLRGGAWQDIEPHVPEPAAVTGEPVVGYGSAPADTPAETPDGDRLTMDLGIATAPSPYIEAPPPPPAEPFRFRASVARPGDTLLLCSSGLAEPLRGEAALAEVLAERWAPARPPGLATFLADTQLRVKGYADDRTAVAVWEA
ncbi:protein phosphatase 2C domain-containing protein [Streptomyces sp. NPDC060064]|uniref:protein phosphatase 2C domain-containing protein n=1 Tax=Streptomyces sp. NPDC060064 TaxID=3347049 RepID=UPI003681F55B